MSDQASQEVLAVKNHPANAGDRTDTSSIPGSGRSPGEGHGQEATVRTGHGTTDWFQIGKRVH